APEGRIGKMRPPATALFPPGAPGFAALVELGPKVVLVLAAVHHSLPQPDLFNFSISAARRSSSSVLSSPSGGRFGGASSWVSSARLSSPGSGSSFRGLVWIMFASPRLQGPSERGLVAPQPVDLARQAAI